MLILVFDIDFKIVYGMFHAQFVTLFQRVSLIVPYIICSVFHSFVFLQHVYLPVSRADLLQCSLHIFYVTMYISFTKADNVPKGRHGRDEFHSQFLETY